MSNLWQVNSIYIKVANAFPFYVVVQQKLISAWVSIFTLPEKSITDCCGSERLILQKAIQVVGYFLL